MNETQIEAGPELDALVAREVMGWAPPDPARQWAPEEWLDTTGSRDWPSYRAFSISYEGMGLVLERMQALGYAPSMRMWPTGWEVRFIVEWQIHEAAAATLPHAVALAALAAVRATTAP